MLSAVLPPASLSHVATDAGSVELAERGQGMPVLCVHGGMGGFDQGLLLAACVLGRTPAFRVLAPSRPGYLGTRMEGRCAPQDHARLFAALLDARGIEKALVIAVSAGGPSSLAFARTYPDRCAGLVLVAAVTGPLDIPPGAARRLPLIRVAARVPPLADAITWVARVWPERAARRSILDSHVRRATMAHPEAGPLMCALQESVASRIPDRLFATLNDVAQFNRMPRLDLRGLSVPVLAIHGSADRVVPVSHLDRVAAEVPGVSLLRLAGGEHVCLVTHLEQIRAATLAFAQSCATGLKVGAG